MSRECVLYAIESSVIADVKTMNYINKVLNSLFTSGVKDKDQLSKYIQVFESNRARSNQNSNDLGKSQKDEYDHDVSKIRGMFGVSKTE